MSLPTPHAHPPFIPIRATLARRSLWQRKTFPAHIKHKLFNFFFFRSLSLNVSFRSSSGAPRQHGGGGAGRREQARETDTIYFIWAEAESKRSWERASVIGACNENYETLSLIDFINLFGILFALCPRCVRVSYVATSGSSTGIRNTFSLVFMSMLSSSILLFMAFVYFLWTLIVVLLCLTLRTRGNFIKGTESDWLRAQMA